MPTEPIPIACSLTPAGATAQLAEWAVLREGSSGTEAIPGGRRLWFPVELAATVEDLAAREAACCAFLTIETARIGDRVRVDITADDPDAAPVIDALTDAG
ncbi:MAG: hypothetical protein AAFZ07_17570 [Actinomycetota bacterium]